jgi:exonuclease SbcD
VGSLAHVTAAVFPDCLDYLALGHLHVPQRVGGSEVMRYSGSPLPMGFGEAGQRKQVCEIEFTQSRATVRTVDVPVFQRLKRVRGDWEATEKDLRELAAANESWWLEIVYDGEDIAGDLRERLEEVVAGSGLEILRVKNNRITERVLRRMNEEERLDELTPDQVFERCLAAHEAPEERRRELLYTYREALTSLQETDSGAQE